MKSALIAILMVALLAAAFFTRPGRREFMLHMLDREGWNPSGIERADRAMKDIQIKDRILWVDVEKDGKVVYTGVFAHWFARDGGDVRKTTPGIGDLARLIGKV